MSAGMHVSSLANFILASIEGYVIIKRIVFGVDINSVHSQYGYSDLLQTYIHKQQVGYSRNCIKSAYNCLLSCYRTSKSKFEQRHSTGNVTKTFRLIRVWNWGQVLFQKYSFKNGVFNSPLYKCFKTCMSTFKIKFQSPHLHHPYQYIHGISLR